MQTLHYLKILVYIVFGALALLVGRGPLLSAKGGTRHARFGRWFLGLAAGTFTTAVLTAYQLYSPFLPSVLGTTMALIFMDVCVPTAVRAGRSYCDNSVPKVQNLGRVMNDRRFLAGRHSAVEPVDYDHQPARQCPWPTGAARLRAGCGRALRCSSLAVHIHRMQECLSI